VVFQLKNNAYKLLDDFLGPSEVAEVQLQAGSCGITTGKSRSW